MLAEGTSGKIGPNRKLQVRTTRAAPRDSRSAMWTQLPKPGELQAQYSIVQDFGQIMLESPWRNQATAFAFGGINVSKRGWKGTLIKAV